MASCYNLINCANPATILAVSSPTTLTAGQVVSLLPGEIPLDYQTVPNCWTVSEEQVCTGLETPITTVTVQVDCPTCLNIGETCYKLTSCTPGNNTILYSHLPELAYLLVTPPGTVELASYPGICFTIEILTAPCECGPIAPFDAAEIIGPCTCNNLDICYTLTDCTNPAITYDTLTNLNPYVGQSISVPQYAGCFTVTTKPITVCINAAPVTCAVICSCPAPNHCYKLQNCQVLGAVFYVTSANPLVIGNVISLLPTEIPVGYEIYPNCWSIVSEVTCDGTETTITTVTIHKDCPTCLGTFYTLTSCFADGPTYCTFDDLSLYTGTTVSVSGLVGCYTVSVGVGTCASPISAPAGSVTPCTCPHCYLIENCLSSTIVFAVSSLVYPGYNNVISITSPFPIPPGLPNCWTVKQDTPCLTTTTVITYNSEIDCPTCIAGPPPDCYKLTSCDGLTVIYSNSNLAGYVGGSITNVPGYSGLCFSVVVADRGQCNNPITVDSAQPCTCHCYQLVDCVTNQPYIKLFNPTINGLDLSLIVGQAVGTVCVVSGQTETCATGCWRVDNAVDCTGAVARKVTDVKASCQACLETCYALRDCDTQQIVYTISYTTPNPLLPNPATLIGQSLGNLCFTVQHGGCVPGCYYLEIVGPTTDCANAISWLDVVSFTPFPSCLACKASCYLLEPCDPTLPSIIVNNNLSNYLNQVIDVCITNTAGIESCACYTVRPSQTCDGAISIPNVTSTLDSCDSCTYCYCPPGYEKIGDSCQKITNTTPVVHPTIYSVGPGATSPSYGSLGTKFYPNVTPLPYPISESGGQFVDAGLNPLAPVVNINTPGTVWTGPTGGRLNTVGVWTTAAGGAPFNEWIGFTHCIDVPTTKTYCIGIAADNKMRFKIDGTLAVQAANYVVFNFNYWHVFEITLTQGFHIIQLEGLNVGGTASFGAEIYDASSTQLQGFTSVGQLQGVTIFSTFNKIAGGKNVFDTGENSGHTCPPGSTFNDCGNGATCSLIQTVPYVDCPKTFKVIDCDGKVADFITNTDLSAYVTGKVYKVCIPAPPPVVNVYFGTTGYTLTDCKGIVQPFCTTTNLSAYVNTTIVLVGYPGSCFTVTVLQQAQIYCPSPIPVTVDVNATCNCNPPQPPTYNLTDCKGLVAPICTTTNMYAYINTFVVLQGYPGSCFSVQAGQPGATCTVQVDVIVDQQATCNCNTPPPPTWDPGCYCVTVEVAPPAVGQVFDGVFGDAFATCDDCKKICYILTDCKGVADPIKVTGTDLANCLNGVVKIKDCDDICWIVTQADNCDGCIRTVEVLQCFPEGQPSACDVCSPPPVPVEQVVSLKTRAVEPGYNTPACSPEYYDKVNCSFAEQVYAQMLSARYGLEVCCDDGFDMWGIKKQLLDLQSIKNPNLP